ncbi:MAG: pyridoxamine 5'-phosphate oxidase family protein [Promethearchaeota archaeon]
MSKTKNRVHWTPELSEKAVNFTQPDIMLKLIATIDERNWPHLTIITNNRAISKNKIVWGEFSKGLSKKNVLNNPKQGILFMSAEMPYRILQIKADFTHTATEGKDLDHFNKSQLMRYMTYMNIYKIYYANIVAASQIRLLPLGGIAKGIIKSMIGKGGAKTKLNEKRLNVLGYKIFKGPINPKFLAYIDPSDGYPIIIPVIQLTTADHNRLVFSPSALKIDLEAVPINTTVAVLGMNMDLASQLVKGPFIGFRKFRGIKLGVIEIEEIYNSAPPLPGIIYPRISFRPKVEDFKY